MVLLLSQALIGDVGKRPGVVQYLEKDNNSAKIN